MKKKQLTNFSDLNLKILNANFVAVFSSFDICTLGANVKLDSPKRRSKLLTGAKL